MTTLRQQIEADCRVIADATGTPINDLLCASGKAAAHVIPARKAVVATLKKRGYRIGQIAEAWGFERDELVRLR